VFSISPQERNFGRLEGEPEDRYQRAQTVLAWARDCIDKDVLREIEQTQVDDIEQEWRDEAEVKATKREIKQFVDDPPDAVEGWTRFDADHEAAAVAYQAENHGAPSVTAVFETDEGELAAREFTLEEWLDSVGNPR
jgi:hypothetical protein